MTHIIKSKSLSFRIKDGHTNVHILLRYYLLESIIHVKINKFRFIKSKENIHKKGRRWAIPRFQL